jgi:hypothetical protein
MKAVDSVVESFKKMSKQVNIPDYEKVFAEI